MLFTAKATDIEITYDIDSVTIRDNGKLISKGSSPQHYRLARNVFDTCGEEKYELSDRETSKGRVVTLHANHG